jgi:MFS family permease
MSALTRDLRICQASAVLLVLGNLGIGLAPSLPAVAVAIIMLAGGNAAFVALRCVVSHIVPPANLATVYAAIGIMTNMGVLAAGPILAALFKTGMKSGLTGLPYLCIGAAFVVFLVVTLIVPLPKDQIVGGEDLEVGEEEREVLVEA